MRFNLPAPPVKKIYLFLCCVGLAVTLQCCGPLVTRGGGERLQVSLRVPEGESSELFWLGTQSRRLRWLPQKGDAREIDWAEGSAVEWEPHEGDRIAFEAMDSSGRVIVDGAVSVGEEKNVTIPLRRVL